MYTIHWIVMDSYMFYHVPFISYETPLNHTLVGGFEHDFFHILGIIIPTDFHIFQRG